MAKKDARDTVMMICSECKLSNVHTEKNKINTTDRLALSKHCKVCRKHTLHKEKK